MSHSVIVDACKRKKEADPSRLVVLSRHLVLNFLSTKSNAPGYGTPPRAALRSQE
jgi:hypothetical protein